MSVLRTLPVLRHTLTGWGLELSAAQERSLAAFAGQLAAAGHPFTAIVDAGEVEVKHLIDSLSLLLAVDPVAGASVLDVGSGAGFPGIPLKIMRPAISLALLDAARKKVEFMQAACGELGLSGVTFLHARAEDLAREARHRESYDLVVARALAPAVVLAELCLPLVRVGGFCVAMKGPRGQEELEAARPAIALLGGEVDGVIAVELPEGAGSRQLVRLRKSLASPGAYPRRAGIPNKRPLGNQVWGGRNGG